MKKMLFFLVILMLLGSNFALAEPYRVFDYADIFTEDEEIALEEMILDFQMDAAMDFVVLTRNEQSSEEPRNTADDFYDSNDFGMGKNKSGILYYIDMYNRLPYLSTTGEMIDCMTDMRLQYAHEIVYDHLSSGEYAKAVEHMIVVVKAYVYDGIPCGQFRYSVE